MANVTYYLGAGASANALPTYENFAERFGAFTLRFSETYKYDEVTADEAEVKGKLYTMCMKFTQELRHHNTPDTIAKKLFHQGGHELDNLKILLIIFFIEQQLTGVTRDYKRDEVDKRYDTLLASILKPIQGRIEFTGHFNILTWNYDLQFELALARYLNKDVHEVSEMFNMHPRISKRRMSDYRKISSIHLNGVAYCESGTFQNPFHHGRENNEIFKMLVDLLID